MSELSSLVSEYLAFRAARGFQPSRKLERLLNQFAGALPPGRFDGRLFTQAQALGWAPAPVGFGQSAVGPAGLAGSAGFGCEPATTGFGESLV